MSGTVLGAFFEFLGAALLLLGFRRSKRDGMGAGAARGGLKTAPVPRIVYFMGAFSAAIIGFFLFGQSG